MEYLYKISLKDLKKSRHRGKPSILKDYFNKPIIYGWYINNKWYVGLTTNLKIRIKNYLSKAHNNHYISRALNKYEESKIYFYIIKISENLEEDEKLYIEKLNSCNNGYNLTYGGERPLLSESTRNKMIESSRIKKPVYRYNCINKNIEFFPSRRYVAKIMNVNASTIQTAIKRKSLVSKIYFFSDNKDFSNFSKKSQKGKSIGNKNSSKWAWFLEVDNVVFKEYSLKDLYKHCPSFIKESTFIRIAYNRTKNKQNLKIWKILK